MLTMRTNDATRRSRRRMNYGYATLMTSGVGPLPSNDLLTLCHAPARNVADATREQDVVRRASSIWRLTVPRGEVVSARTARSSTNY